MLELTAKNSFSSANYFNKYQMVDSSTHQAEDRITRQEIFQFTTDQVGLTYSSESIQTYNRSMSLEKSFRDGYDHLRGLVLNIFKKQGLDYTVANYDSGIDIGTITSGEAQELIADDGYFGVEKTSERILTFAVGVAGGNPARIDAIREGVDKGFKEALDAFGGWLPDISYDTYDTVLKKLDGWVGVDNSPQSQNQVKS